jgi:hypothetical protein
LNREKAVENYIKEEEKKLQVNGEEEGALEKNIK